MFMANKLKKWGLVGAIGAALLFNGCDDTQRHPTNRRYSVQLPFTNFEFNELLVYDDGKTVRLSGAQLEGEKKKKEDFTATCRGFLGDYKCPIEQPDFVPKRDANRYMRGNLWCFDRDFRFETDAFETKRPMHYKEIGKSDFDRIILEDVSEVKFDVRKNQVFKQHIPKYRVKVSSYRNQRLHEAHISCEGKDCKITRMYRGFNALKLKRNKGESGSNHEIRIEKGLIKASEDVIGQLEDVCARAKKQAKSYNEGEQECGEDYYDDKVFGAYNRCMKIKDK